jgi:hypothetical protein
MPFVLEVWRIIRLQTPAQRNNGSMAMTASSCNPFVIASSFTLSIIYFLRNSSLGGLKDAANRFVQYLVEIVITQLMSQPLR